MKDGIQYILYNLPEDQGEVQVVVENETLWCTQKAMAQLFGVGVPAISKHLKNIFDEGELIREVKPTQKGRFLTLYRVMMSCRKAPPEFRFASSTLRNFVPSGAAHEAAAGHALSEPSDNYPATCINGFSTTIIML